MNCCNKWWTISDDGWLPAIYWSGESWRDVLEMLVETKNFSQTFTTFSGFYFLGVHGGLDDFCKFAKPKWMNVNREKAYWVCGAIHRLKPHHIINLATRNRSTCRLCRSAPPCHIRRFQGISEDQPANCLKICSKKDFPVPDLSVST